MQPRSIAATEQTSDWISEDGRQQVDEQTSGNVPNDEMKPKKETVAEQTYGLVPHLGVPFCLKFFKPFCPKNMSFQSIK